MPNLVFTFSVAPIGDARIIFSNYNIASWSFRGTEAHDVPPTCPTITPVGIADDTNISTYDRGMILHEFGHLLGLLPVSGIIETFCKVNTLLESIARQRS